MFDLIAASCCSLSFLSEHVLRISSIILEVTQVHLLCCIYLIRHPQHFIKFLGLEREHLIKVGAYSRLGAFIIYSNL